MAAGSWVCLRGKSNEVGTEEGQGRVRSSEAAAETPALTGGDFGDQLDPGGRRKAEEAENSVEMKTQRVTEPPHFAPHVLFALRSCTMYEPCMFHELDDGGREGRVEG